MPAARLSETPLLAREAAAAVVAQSSPVDSDSTDYRISPAIVVAIIICSAFAFILAAAMAFFFSWRSDRRTKRTTNISAEEHVDPLDRYTQPPRRQDEKRSKRKWSYSSSTTYTTGDTDALDGAPVLLSSAQADALPPYSPPQLTSLPLARTTSSPSMYSVSSTTDAPVRSSPPPNNRRRSSSVHQLVDVESGRAPSQPTRVSLPLSLRPALPSAPPPSRNMRDNMTVEQMLELMPDARLSYAVMF
ncbi:unnamed protein product [Peniophora sp. CBMAI 1063]|nr:unnamed protein product [Peniophora sp. CBMAI 1063]